ncbi:PST family polysaccharide transporter [Variovorax beijingensis]|uniref:PST family polysaccharide transporter n=1 Tax=Variovorax beijingensis TaxID=2496117 RepID=A0A561C5H0_9BURK|nr:O-antigen translocase [Variovorax beijingensis]TWD86092.1 PST family polysaccharide transporter [Variovorax beijingensis]
MTDAKSYRKILRSSVIIGGASVINILIGLARIKVAAVLLGPAGVGVIGLFQNLIAVASTVVGLGFGNVGTRQIAEAAGRDDDRAVAVARRALAWGTLLLALIGAGIFWALRNILAVIVLGDAESGTQIQWLAIGVAVTVGASAQTALLNGLRRIGDIALASVFSALLSTVVGICVLLWWGQTGVVAFVLIAPLCTFLLGYVFVLRLPRENSITTPWPLIVAQWRTLAKLGAAFMLAGVVATLAQLLVRTIVQKNLGASGLGVFQASWQISMTYLGFVLSAMGTDYYPRLTACIDDYIATNRMVNEQTEVALILGGPVLLAMMGLAPWIIGLLYSNEFQEAQDVLRWQIIGDLLKILSWPLGFILLAAGNGRAYLITETIGFGFFVILTAFFLPLLGIRATGIAFIGMYAVYLPMVYWLAHKKTKFQWSAKIWRQFGAVLGLCVFVKLLAEWDPLAGAIFGLAGAMGLAGLAAAQFSSIDATETAAGRLYAKVIKKMPMQRRRR